MSPNKASTIIPELRRLIEAARGQGRSEFRFDERKTPGPFTPEEMDEIASLDIPGQDRVVVSRDGRAVITRKGGPRG